VVGAQFAGRPLLSARLGSPA